MKTRLEWMWRVVAVLAVMTLLAGPSPAWAQEEPPTEEEEEEPGGTWQLFFDTNTLIDGALNMLNTLVTEAIIGLGLVVNNQLNPLTLWNPILIDKRPSHAGLVPEDFGLGQAVYDSRFRGAWNVMLPIGLGLAPGILALIIAGASKDSIIGSGSGFGTLESALAEWAGGVILAFVSLYALDVACRLSNALIAGLGDASYDRFVSMLFRLPASYYTGAELHTAALIILGLATIPLGIAVIVSLVIQHYARFALLLIIVAIAPIVLVLSILRPLRWLRSLWLKGAVLVTLLGPINALLIRVGSGIVLHGAAQPFLQFMMVFAMASILLAINGTVIKSVFSAGMEVYAKVGEGIKMGFAMWKRNFDTSMAVGTSLAAGFASGGATAGAAGGLGGLGSLGSRTGASASPPSSTPSLPAGSGSNSSTAAVRQAAAQAQPAGGQRPSAPQAQPAGGQQPSTPQARPAGGQKPGAPQPQPAGGQKANAPPQRPATAASTGGSGRSGSTPKTGDAMKRWEAKFGGMSPDARHQLGIGLRALGTGLGPRSAVGRAASALGLGIQAGAERDARAQVGSPSGGGHPDLPDLHPNEVRGMAKGMRPFRSNRDLQAELKARGTSFDKVRAEAMSPVYAAMGSQQQSLGAIASQAGFTGSDTAESVSAFVNYRMATAMAHNGVNVSFQHQPVAGHRPAPSPVPTYADFAAGQQLVWATGGGDMTAYAGLHHAIRQHATPRQAGYGYASDFFNQSMKHGSVDKAKQAAIQYGGLAGVPEDRLKPWLAML